MRLYVDERLSTGDVAKRLGVPRHDVQNSMRRLGIPARSRSEAARLREAKPEFREWRVPLLRKGFQVVSPEARKRQGSPKSGKRKPLSAEHRAAMSARMTPEMRERIASAQRGEKSVHWRGGVKTRGIESWEWRIRRRECYERDGWLCQDCGVHCTKRGVSRIQAHHIIRRRDGGTDDLVNLVTLCATCHTSRERRFADALFA